MSGSIDNAGDDAAAGPMSSIYDQYEQRAFQQATGLAPDGSYVGSQPTPQPQQGALPVGMPVQQAPRPQVYDPGSFQPAQGQPDVGIAEDVSEAPKQGGSVLGTFARQAWVSTLQLGSGLWNMDFALNRALGSDPEFLAQQKQTVDQFQNYIANQVSRLPPKAQQAMQASLFGGKDDQGNPLPTPGQVGWGRYVGAQLASLVPQAVMALLPAGVVGGAITKTIGLTAGRIAAGATTATAFGTVNAGDAYRNLTDGIDRASEQQLMQSPAYAALREQGLSDIDARKELVAKIAPSMAALHFGVGAAAGAGLGGILRWGAGIGDSLIARAGMGAAEGAAVMGGQAAGDTAIDQRTQQQLGQRTGFDPAQIAMAFASGAVPGAVLGAAGGAFHGAEPAELPPVPEDRSAEEIEREGGTPPEETEEETEEETPPARSEPPAKPEDASPKVEVAAPAPPVGEETPPPLETSAPAGTTQLPPDVQEAMTEALKPEGGAPAAPAGIPAPTATSAPGLGKTLVQKLGKLGYSPEEIGKLSPVTARAIVKGKIAKEVPAAAAEEPAARAAEPAETVAPATPVGASAPIVQEVSEGQEALRTVQPPAELPDETKAPGAAPIAEEPPSAPATPQTVGDKLKAKRALEKQRMAQTTTRQKGQGAVAEAAPARAEETPASSEITEPFTIDPITDAAARAGRAEGLPKAVLDKWVASVAKVVQGSKSADEAHEALASWGAKDRTAKAAPGAKATRAAVADHTLQLLRGKGLPDLRRRAEIRGETRQPEVFEKEGVAHPDVLTEQAPEGTEEPQRAESTTDLKRIGGDLVEDVLAGRKTPEEAAAAFGTQKPGPGRPRRWRDFAHFLDEHIQELDEKPMQAPPTQAPAPRSLEDRATALLNAAAAREHMEKLKALRDTLPGAKKTREELRESIKAKTAARKAKSSGIAASAVVEPATTGHNLLTKILVSAAREAPVNRKIAAELARAGANNAPTSLHKLLRMVVFDKDVRSNPSTMHYAKLAERLLHFTPDVPVHTDATIAGTNFDTESSQSMRGKAYGYASTDPGQQHIYLNNNYPEHMLETLVHEGLHTATLPFINAHREFSTGEALTELRNELYGALNDPDNEHLVRAMSSTTLNRIRYAMSDNHEIHTMLMSSPEVQAFASQVHMSDFTRSRLNDLGYGLRGKINTLWDGFRSWVRRALGLYDRQTFPDNFLDHALHASMQVMDEADRFNRRVATPARQTEISASAIPDATRRVIKDIDPAGLNDRARRGWLTGAPLQDIVRWNRNLFKPSDRLAVRGNPLERFRAALEGTAATTKAFHDKYGDLVHSLIDRLQGPERDKLGRLMTDTTLANVRLGRGADNSHLKTQAQLDMAKALQARYDALTPAGRATYDAARDYYRQAYKAERDARMGALVDSALPDLDGATRAALMKGMETKKGTDAILNDTSPVAKAFGTKWDSSRALVKAVAKVRRLGFVDGDYFPLRRFGDYVVRYGERTGDGYGVEMFEHRGAAEERRAELAKQGVDNFSQVMQKSESNLREMLPSNPILEEFDNVLQTSPTLSAHADAVHEALQRILLEHASRSERARMAQRRKGIAGASTDSARILAREFLSTGTTVGHLSHTLERNQALADMKLVADDLGHHGEKGQGIVASSVLREAQRRVATGDDAHSALSGAARRASTLGFVQSLMSPSHMVTSSIESHTNAAALMGARHGLLRPGLALAKAMAEISPRVAGAGVRNTFKALGKGLRTADWSLSNLARDRLIASGADAANMRDLFDGPKGLNAAGLIDHTAVAEMRRIAGLTGGPIGTVTKAWQRFLDFNAAGAHAVDVLNKSAIAKAAYDLELRRSGSHDTARDYAVEMARQVAPNYNLSNKNRLSTDKGPLGAFAAPLTQFKQYGFFMYGMMANLAKESVHGASREARWEARKAFAGVLATHTMMAGALTLLADPLRYAGGLYDLATGASAPHNYQNDVRSWMAETFGPELGEIISRGLPHAAGIDIHRRVGLSNLMEIPEIDSFKSKDIGAAIGTAMIGAAGEDMATIAGGIAKMLHGDIEGGLKDTVPRVARDVMKAVALADQGVTDTKGRTILAPEKIGPTGVAAQALGFQPSVVTEFREGRNAVLEAREEAKSDHAQALQDWLAASRTDQAAATERVREYNMQHPDNPITVGQMLRAQQGARKAAVSTAQGSYGLQLPNRQAATLRQAGAFANVP